MRKNSLRKISTKHAFLAGIGSGIVLMILCFGLLVSHLFATGVTVYLDSGEIAEMVRAQIVQQAKTDLPRVIEEAKAEVPDIVAKEMADALPSDRMEIAGFVFRMPQELIDELRSGLQTNVENATTKILDGINTSLLADQFGDDAYRMIQETMIGQFGDQEMTVMLFDRFPLRVNVVLQ